MQRVVYSITEYEPLLDSSNMTMADWSHIAEDIYVSLRIRTPSIVTYHAFLGIMGGTWRGYELIGVKEFMFI